MHNSPSLETNQAVALVKRDGSILKTKIKELHVFEGLGRKKVSKIMAGEICALVGLDGFEIGDTISCLPVILVYWSINLGQVVKGLSLKMYRLQLVLKWSLGRCLGFAS